MSGLSVSLILHVLHLKKKKSHARSPKIAKIQLPGTHEIPAWCLLNTWGGWQGCPNVREGRFGICLASAKCWTAAVLLQRGTLPKNPPNQLSYWWWLQWEWDCVAELLETSRVRLGPWRSWLKEVLTQVSSESGNVSALLPGPAVPVSVWHGVLGSWGCLRSMNECTLAGCTTQRLLIQLCGNSASFQWVAGIWVLSKLKVIKSFFFRRTWQVLGNSQAKRVVLAFSLLPPESALFAFVPARSKEPAGRD